MSPTTASDRTRSRRYRAGSRRNKRLHTYRTQLSDVKNSSLWCAAFPSGQVAWIGKGHVIPFNTGPIYYGGSLDFYANAIDANSRYGPPPGRPTVTESV